MDKYIIRNIHIVNFVHESIKYFDVYMLQDDNTYKYALTMQTSNDVPDEKLSDIVDQYVKDFENDNNGSTKKKH
jgi:hypothetical protein